MEEEDTCRICRSGPEEDMPLYHPCKCSGSIAKVHQDCLIDWLQHSKKKSCELCNTELRFHKVYSPTMPIKLPFYLYVRRFLIQTLFAFRYAVRAIIVSLCWLVLLPLANMGMWKLHFIVVDTIVWGIVGGAPPPSRTLNHSFNATALSSANATSPSSSIHSELPLLYSNTSSGNFSTTANVSSSNLLPLVLLDRKLMRLMTANSSATIHDTLDALAHQTFEGQMLTCAVVLFFVAFFLLREWCLQHLPQPVEGLAFAPGPAQPPQPFPFAGELEDDRPEPLVAGREEVVQAPAEAVDTPQDVANEEGDDDASEVAAAGEEFIQAEAETPDTQPARIDEAEDDDATSDVAAEVGEDDEEPDVPLLERAEVAVQDGPLFDAQDWEDEPENGDRLEDDLEGMMEAIGLRGPLLNLFTNMVMMFVLCSLVLAVFVALPYFIGRTFGVGTNLIKLISLPIQGLRFLTDPVVDKIVHYSTRVTKSLTQYFGIITIIQRKLSGVLVGASKRNGLSQVINLRHTLWNGETMGGKIGNVTSANGIADGATNQVVSIVSTQTPRSFKALEASVLSLIGNVQDQSRRIYASVRHLFLVMEAKTLGVSYKDKVFCILLGHFYWLVGLLAEHNGFLLSNKYTRWNSKWLKTTVEHHLTVLKVLGFIILELAIFPWCCGVLLDLSLFSLWEDVTLSSRVALLRSKPLSVCFTQWALGTLYMFALAQFVANTRSIVRPGVLCFVRDAGDPSFHPIKDILERRAGEQLRKIGVSGLIYSSILTGTIGVCSIALYYIDRKARIVPLRWEMHQSLTTTGLEYMIIAVALPPLFKAWLPAHVIKRAVKGWWRFVARQLRISSYLIGGLYPNERGQFVRKTWKAALTLKRSVSLDTGHEDDDVYFVENGGFGRVPADDHAIMSSPIVIRTDAEGKPVSDRGREAVQEQEIAIAKMTKKPQYTVVYLPPHFRGRIFALLAALWATVCVAFLIGLLAPLLIGRFVLDSLFVSTSHPPLHDGFSWLIGVILIGGAVQTAKTTRRLLRSNHPSKRLARLARRGVEFAWMSFFVSLSGSLLGICVELHFNALSEALSPTKRKTMPDISILHASVMGTLLQYIAVQLLELRRGAVVTPLDWENMPLNTASGFYAMMELRSANLRRPRMWLLTKRGFLPSIAVYLYAIFAPFALLYAFQSLFGKASTTRGEKLQLYLAFNLCTKVLWFGFFTKALDRLVERWTALIRDERFLVSTELKNYPSEGKRAEKQAESSSNGVLAADGPLPDALLNR